MFIYYLFQFDNEPLLTYLIFFLNPPTNVGVIFLPANFEISKLSLETINGNKLSLDWQELQNADCWLALWVGMSSRLMGSANLDKKGGFPKEVV